MPTDKKTSPEPYVGEKTAAEHLGVSTRTLQRWRTSPPEHGAPKFFKLGKRVAYRLSDLDNWAESQQFSHTSEFQTSESGS